MMPIFQWLNPNVVAIHDCRLRMISRRTDPSAVSQFTEERLIKVLVGLVHQSCSPLLMHSPPLLLAFLPVEKLEGKSSWKCGPLQKRMECEPNGKKVYIIHIHV